MGWGGGGWGGDVGEGEGGDGGELQRMSGLPLIDKIRAKNGLRVKYDEGSWARGRRPDQ